MEKKTISPTNFILLHIQSIAQLNVLSRDDR